MDQQSILYLLLGLFIVYLYKRQRNPLHSLPTVGGPSWPILSYIGAYRFVNNAQAIVQEGYDKHRGKAFKIAMFDQWLVVLSGSDVVEQVRKSPDEVISAGRGLLFVTQIDKFVHPTSLTDTYHIDLIRDKLTRKLGDLIPSMIDELEVVASELFPKNAGESVALVGNKTIMNMVARVGSRAFVGAPACRNKEYLRSAIMYTIDLVRARRKMHLLPEAVAVFASKYITGPKDNVRRVVSLLEEEVKERMAFIGSKNADEAPRNDMLQWLLEEGHERHEPMEVIITRLQLQNFASIHTSSHSGTHTLFHLLANPEIIEPLREDIRSVLAEEGWTKVALDKMWKLDSLLKESQRYSGINFLGMFRTAMEDVVLVDGTHLPKGTLLAFPQHAIHNDSHYYPGSENFDAFRFSDSRSSGDNSARQQFVNTAPDYLPFGRGKHACPGRFFASAALKAILAYLIMNFDMKLENGKERPADATYTFSLIPSTDAVVVFTKRP